jgi:hypothetical protein
VYRCQWLRHDADGNHDGTANNATDATDATVDHLYGAASGVLEQWRVL